MKSHQSYFKTAFIVFLVFLLQKNSFSQTVVNLYDPVSIKEFNHILDTCSSKEVTINIFFENLSFVGDSIKKETLGKSDKNLDIYFQSYSHNLRLENLIVLSNTYIQLEDSVRIKNLEHRRFSGTYKIKNCVIEKFLNIFSLKNEVLIESSNFKNRFWETLDFGILNSKNTFFKECELRFNAGVVDFDNCYFSSFNSDANSSNGGMLSFKKCSLDRIENSKSEKHIIEGKYDHIKFDSCTILSPLKFIGGCEKSISITSFGNPKFDFSGFTFPSDPYSTQIPIGNLNHDPVIISIQPFNKNSKNVEIRKGMGPLEINLIIASYRKMLDVYKSNGDQTSYNKLYRFSKRAKNLILIQQKDKDLNVWFEFYFNRFLDWYCDYGTNPVKALIYSFYLVLIFAGLFILFPSEPDNLQRHFFIEKIGKYLSYFSSDSHLADLKRKEYEQELAELEDFRLNLEDTIKKAPSIIPWISKPYYRISMMYFNIHLWLLEKVDFSRLSWNRMSKKQRIKASLIMTVYMFGFIFWGIVVRVMNGLALSMNAFITLGYGEITAKGIARYLAVVEGCMGWFLLSIFSVSLIAQMMQ